MRGCAGSRLTGPAPLGGAVNSPESATHPTLGLGAKLGGAACELAGVEAAPAMKNTPASAGPVRSMDVAQTLDMTAPFPCGRYPSARRLASLKSDPTPAAAVPTNC